MWVLCAGWKNPIARVIVADMDLPTATLIGTTVLGSRESLNRLLGPTADYIGDELLTLVKRCNINLEKVFQIAVRKVGDRITEPATANPRVLQQVITGGMFCEDELIAEYLGGVLASARTADGRDDRGVCFLDDIKSLSSYQLRTHYLVYSAITKYGCQEKTNPKSWYSSNAHETITLTFTDDSYLAAMSCENALQKQLIGKHSFLGLEARQLLSGGVEAFEEWEEEKAKTHEPWRFCWPTQYGHELFAWGLGLGDTQLTSYFDIPAEHITDILPPLQVTKLEMGQIFYEGKVRSY